MPDQTPCTPGVFTDQCPDSLSQANRLILQLGNLPDQTMTKKIKQRAVEMESITRSVYYFNLALMDDGQIFTDMVS